MIKTETAVELQQENQEKICPIKKCLERQGKIVRDKLINEWDIVRAKGLDSCVASSGLYICHHMAESCLYLKDLIIKFDEQLCKESFIPSDISLKEIKFIALVFQANELNIRAFLEFMSFYADIEDLEYLGDAWNRAKEMVKGSVCAVKCRLFDYRHTFPLD